MNKITRHRSVLSSVSLVVLLVHFIARLGLAAGQQPYNTAETYAAPTNPCQFALESEATFITGTETIRGVDDLTKALGFLRAQLASAPVSTVVYCPLIVLDGTVTLRMESKGYGKDIDEQLIARTAYHCGELQQFAQMARGRDSQGIRDKLAQELMPHDAKADLGKATYLCDLTHCGFTPADFELKGAASIKTSLKASLSNRAKLADRQKLAPRDFLSIVGYPTNQEDQDFIFEGKTVGTPAEWSRHLAELKSVSEAFGSQVVDSDTLRQSFDKAGLMREMENAKGIVMVLAHSNGTTIRLPGRDPIELTTADIQSLNLKMRPFVVIRICENLKDNSLFSSAFLQAGAKGVWINSGSAAPSDVKRDISSFFDGISKGLSIGDVIGTIDSDSTLYAVVPVCLSAM